MVPVTPTMSTTSTMAVAVWPGARMAVGGVDSPVRIPPMKPSVVRVACATCWTVAFNSATPGYPYTVQVVVPTLRKWMGNPRCPLAPSVWPKETASAENVHFLRGVFGVGARVVVVGTVPIAGATVPVVVGGGTVVVVGGTVKVVGGAAALLAWLGLSDTPRTAAPTTNAAMAPTRARLTLAVTTLTVASHSNALKGRPSVAAARLGHAGRSQ